jgi:hypothetical protein
VICNVIPIFISKTTSCKDQQHGQVICKLDQQQGQVICKLDQQEDNVLLICKNQQGQCHLRLQIRGTTTQCPFAFAKINTLQTSTTKQLKLHFKGSTKQQSHFKEKFEGGR